MAKFVIFTGTEDEIIALDPKEVCAVFASDSEFAGGRSIFLKSGKVFLVKESFNDIYTAIDATAE